ncbi:MAG: deoxyribonuclease IV [Candidatus Micrarchaeaceae archaeon]
MRGNMLMLRIGHHISVSGGFAVSLERAHAIGYNTMQIFVSNPRAWSIKSIGLDEASKFALKARSMDIEPVFAHMPYLPNFSSASDSVHQKSVKALRDTLLNCKALGIMYLVVHLGSHMGKGKQFGLRRIESAINGIDTLNVTLLFENEAGQRNAMGSSIEELLEVLDLVKTKNKGFCIDTCHAFAAGYDIRKEEVLDNMAKALSGKIKLIHLNDARFGLGSRLDRHAIIGKGFIGKEGIGNVLRKFAKTPFIMETSWKTNYEAAAELRLVKRLAHS